MKLVIYQTSDLHGFVYPTNYVTEKSLGILKIGTYILKDEKKYDASLKIDCGDLVQGSALTHYLSKQKLESNPIVELLEDIGYDGYVLGNHEFNYGLDYLNTAYKGISEKIINANGLVNYIKATFGLCTNREDTYIGGLSMGGFGAIHTALKYNDTFSKAFALSSALIIHDIKNRDESFSNGVADYYYYGSVFGNLNYLEKSENNPEELVRRLKNNSEVIPSIFMACGKQDFLIEQNRAFHKFLIENDINVDYKEDDGSHDWEFWNKYLEKSIEWLLK